MAKGQIVSKVLAVFAIVVVAAILGSIIAVTTSYIEERKKNPVTTLPPPTTTPSPDAPCINPWDESRLPDTLIPSGYNVRLWPSLKPNDEGMFTFKGTSNVVFKCEKETDLIVIHSRLLNLTKKGKHLADVMDVSSSKSVDIQYSCLDTSNEFLVVQLLANLTEGKTYEMITDFTGELSDDLVGFYRSEYMEGGEKKLVATTQMQPTYARTVFPCFDEPAMKAHFNITLIHDLNLVALSNSPVIDSMKSTIDGAEWGITRFHPTPDMSTYLLAFIVCDFKNISALDRDVLIRIWARPEAIAEQQGDYALNITGPILQYFKDYYDIPYPLAKSDQIALPDFSTGAMENWGLVTYRETALLYNPNISSTSNKEWVATVIAHELAHQWFGNLVTMRWWNDLWLNEGFATYVSYLGADHAEPSWNIKDLIVLHHYQKVFAEDALNSSHPLSLDEDEINTPLQIGYLFDSITYSKGAAVLRMLSGFLTENLFVEGLKTYLAQYKYNNTVYQDLWGHLQEAVDKQSSTTLPDSVENIMNRWVLQMGFPVVTINTTTGTLTQKHFLLDRDAEVTRSSQFNYTWFVPVSWMKSGILQDDFWLLNTSESNTTVKSNSTDWVLANINCSGYYRVNYDIENWNRLLQQLQDNFTKIPVINRAQLIDDAFNLARAGYIPTTLALDTTKYLSKDTEYMPWESAINNLGYFSLMFDRTEVNGPMQTYLRKQVTPLFNYFENITANWTEVPSGHTDQYNQVTAIEVACKNGLKKCRELASSLYQEWMDNPSVNPIHPNLKTTIYCNAIAAGGVEEWDFAWERFQNATIATEADKLRYGLSCSRHIWILNRYLKYTLDPKKIRKMDSIPTISYISRNVVGQSLVWDFIQAYSTTICSGSSPMDSLLEGVTQRFSTELELRQLQQFRQSNNITEDCLGMETLSQAIERTQLNIKWINENKDPVFNWFTSSSL
ncbi:aminopeptidase N-like [Polyodon spathula]|uniref:aminopeptidase N-like n=1 Tax=Polyodon spathula TaxID=7913 RepID=UPI001B7F2225|nr:aminopeptidase N-like [Polyodon spathula]